MDNDLPNHFQIQGNQKYTESIDSQGPLRRSLFGGVPPFINYVPAGGFTGGTEKGPQYWDENKVNIGSFQKYLNYFIIVMLAPKSLINVLFSLCFLYRNGIKISYGGFVWPFTTGLMMPLQVMNWQNMVRYAILYWPNNT